MLIEKSSDNYRILESGSVMNYSCNSSLQFSVQMDPTFSFSLIFKFEDNDDSNYDIKSTVSGTEITIVCTNFKSALGTGTTTPIELATFQGKKIYIVFWIYGLGEKAPKKMDYTFFSA